MLKVQQKLKYLFTKALDPIVIKYSDLKSGKNLEQQIETAYGPQGK